jgi:S-DNA-T family DNA segregation ATPase FtsK/SpoIIIE
MTDLHESAVVQLHKPSRGPASDIEPHVFDGELVDDQEQRPAERPGRALLWRPSAELVTTMGRSGVLAATGRLGRRGLRATWVIGQGGTNWGRRVWAAGTHGNIREQIRISRAAGDREGLAAWTDRLEEAKGLRIERLVALPKVVIGVAIGGGSLVLTALIVLTLIGLAVQLAPDGATWGDWWAGVGAALDLIGLVTSIAYYLVCWLFTPAVVLAAYLEGRRVGDPPMWLMTTDERAQVGSEITTDTISAALAHMKITALTRALKEGAVLEFIVPPREQGGGTYFQVRLPMGVIAADMLASTKVELLAGNLMRHKHETWPQRQPDADARVLDCWVADKGAMDRPAPAWPLLLDGTVNVFRDMFPWGVTMRGEPVLVVVLQKHWLIGANSKQGKTTVVRTFILFVALDVAVELRIADLKGDGDFRMLKERCHTYIEGQADEDAEAAVVMLEDVVVEMRRRYDEKARRNITGPITEKLAREPGSGFHPIWVVVDECQVMYMAGKAADGSQLGGSKDEARAQAAAKRLHDQARAVLIHLVQSTQRPDPQTMPVRVREGVHVRVALYVPNINAAKMILADAAERGARPHDLRPGRDAGTVVAAGEVEAIPEGQAFTIVRTHYVSTKEAHAVAARAIANWRKAGRAPAPAIVVDAKPVDHLADIERALRDELRVRTQVVLSRLMEDDPRTYRKWDLVKLTAVLEDEFAPTLKTSGVMYVVAERVSQALLRPGRVPASLTP